MGLRYFKVAELNSLIQCKFFFILKIIKNTIVLSKLLLLFADKYNFLNWHKFCMITDLLINMFLQNFKIEFFFFMLNMFCYSYF